MFSLLFCRVLFATEASSVPSTRLETKAVEEKAAPGNLNLKQLSAVITITGSGGRGTGFVCMFNKKPVIITNQHVLAGSPSVSFETQSGVSIPIQSVYAASNADLALLIPQSLPPDVAPLEILMGMDQVVKKDDPNCIPGNSKGDGVITQTFGKIIAVGPNRVEIDNPIYPGNSGSPIVHTDTGKVIGVLTYAKTIQLDRVSQQSFRSRNSAIKTLTRYFGYRVDTVPSWQRVNWEGFQKLNSQIGESRQELDWILDFFTGASDSYKQFPELHKAVDKTMGFISQKDRSVQDKIFEFERFLRDVDFLIRKTETRVAGAVPLYVQVNEIAEIHQIAAALKDYLEIAKRDKELTRFLLDRAR
jgi:hypothetical protein